MKLKNLNAISLSIIRSSFIQPVACSLKFVLFQERIIFLKKVIFQLRIFKVSAKKK